MTKPHEAACDILPHQVHELVARYRVVIVRGVAELDLPKFGAALGPLLEWEFGAVNELTARAHARNYLYTAREVPFRWDGAFLGRIPRYIVFHCLGAPRSGGETLFCDTPRLYAAAGEAERRRWADVEISYSTEKIAHYGGRFSSPLLGRHPLSGEPTLRFAEPVDDLNPVRLELRGVADPGGFLADMARRLRDPQFCYAHAWQAGDLVIADNHALLHGRRAFSDDGARHLRRVNVM